MLSIQILTCRGVSMIRLRNRLMSMTALSLRYSEGASAGFSGGSAVSAMAAPAENASPHMMAITPAISCFRMIFLFPDMSGYRGCRRKLSVFVRFAENDVA